MAIIRFHCLTLLCVAAGAFNKAPLVKVWICLRQFLRQRVEHIFQACFDALAVLADMILRKPIGQYLKMFPSHDFTFLCLIEALLPSNHQTSQLAPACRIIAKLWLRF